MPVTELESHLGFWLRFVSNHVSESFRRRVEERGVAISDWVVLRRLYREGKLAPTSFVDILGMTKGAVSKILSRLEERGLITRSAVEDDRRAQRIALTAAGRKLVPQLARLADENDELFFGHMSARDREALKQTLMELVHVHGLHQVPTD